MKLRLYLLAITAIAAVVSCGENSKQILDEATNDSTSDNNDYGKPGPREVTFRADIYPMSVSNDSNAGGDASDGSKATIDTGIESRGIIWEDDEEISLICKAPEDILDEDGQTILCPSGSKKLFTLKAHAKGNDVFFSGVIDAGWEETGFALSPTPEKSNLEYSLESGFSEGVKITIPDEVCNLNESSPLSSFPLVGKKQDDGSYRFYTTMNICWFNVKNLPLEMHRFSFFTASGGHLMGTFDVDFTADDWWDPSYTKAAIYPGNWQGENDSNLSRYITYTPSVNGEEKDFFFPVPIGDVLAGSRISISDKDGKELFSRTFTKGITINRGNMIIKANLKLPDLNAPTPSAANGE